MYGNKRKTGSLIYMLYCRNYEIYSNYNIGVENPSRNQSLSKERGREIDRQTEIHTCTCAHTIKMLVLPKRSLMSPRYENAGEKVVETSGRGWEEAY